MSGIKMIKLGNQGLEVPMQGLGCMGMTTLAGQDVYGLASEKESIATIHRALELGINFLDTADMYGPQLNERLVEKAIRGNRDNYIIATKFGYEIDDNEQLTWRMNGSADYVKKSIERSLKNLNTDFIDLYYLHRVDPETPIEETVGAMAELVQAGKVRYLGLSEVSAQTLKKANLIHPISAVQTEYSLFERSVETNGLFDTIHELGVGFVSYSPLGRGFLTGEITSPDDFSDSDFRRNMPRFQGENFYKNLDLVRAVQKMAAIKNISPSQLAIAWTQAKGTVPIPGTKRVRFLEDNVAASAVTFSKDEMESLDAIVPDGAVIGDRYDQVSMAGLNL